MRPEPLNIRDDRFLLNRLIQQAPTSTLVREFFKNAEESAATSAEGERQILIYPVEVDGVRKLAFWNTGPGMDAPELVAATDLSSSVNKEMSLDGNFGIGAKVSGLSASPYGIRYRSCKDGIVREILIGWDDDEETYVRFPAQTEDGQSDIVIDVTSAVTQATTSDWTEVTLLGTHEAHDTVTFPLGESKQLDRSYIATTIFRRFARFAPGVEVRIDTAMTKGGGKRETGRYRSLKTLEQVLDRVGRWERVVDPSTGIAIRYVHDPKHDAGHSYSARANPATSSTTFCALVHKSERYDFRTQKSWSAAAPNFGVPFGSKVLTIEIELPQAMAQPSQYRDSLTNPADREPILTEDFSQLTRELMPEWVREVIRAESPQRDDNLDDLREDLQRLLDEFRLPTSAVRNVNRGAPSFEADSNTHEAESSHTELGDEVERVRDELSHRGGRRAGQRKIRLAPIGAQVSELTRALERAPEIQILDREEDVAEKGIQGRAAGFYKDIQTVFVNGLYSAVDRMAAELELDFADPADPEALRALVLQASQRWAAYRVGKTICFALAKRILNDWTTADVEKATTPEALSMAADDYRQSMTAAKRWVSEQLKISQLAEAA